MLFDFARNAILAIGNKIYQWGYFEYNGPVYYGHSRVHTPFTYEFNDKIDSVKCSFDGPIILSNGSVFHLKYENYSTTKVIKNNFLTNISLIDSYDRYLVAIEQNKLYVWGQNVYGSESSYIEPHMIEIDCNYIYAISCCSSRIVILSDTGLRLLGNYGSNFYDLPEKIEFSDFTTNMQVKCNDSMIIVEVDNKIYTSCYDKGFNIIETGFVNPKIFTGFETNCVYIVSGNDIYVIDKSLTISKKIINIDDVIIDIFYSGDNIFVICQNGIYCRGDNKNGELGLKNYYIVTDLTIHDFFTEMKLLYVRESRVKNANFKN